MYIVMHTMVHSVTLPCTVWKLLRASGIRRIVHSSNRVAIGSRVQPDCLLPPWGARSSLLLHSRSNLLCTARGTRTSMSRLSRVYIRSMYITSVQSGEGYIQGRIAGTTTFRACRMNAQTPSLSLRKCALRHIHVGDQHAITTHNAYTYAGNASLLCILNKHVEQKGGCNYVHACAYQEKHCARSKLTLHARCELCRV
jgi:hypothetical protein